MQQYDLLLRGVRIFDPVNGVDMLGDIAIEDGKIGALQPYIAPNWARECRDLRGMVAVPGIIDMHVHAGDVWGSCHAQTMLAKAGVCTALDMAGPLENVLRLLPKHSAGLNLAILQYASPPFTLADSNPSPQALRKLVSGSLDGGAYGVKLLGGHYPLTPEASRALIAQTREQGGYVAWHAGTTSNGSDIQGMREAIECAEGHFLHLAHINSYCRGAVHSELDEMQEAIEMLIKHPNIYSESYLSPLNGTRLACKDGVPTSEVTRNCLRRLGFEATQAGMEEAFKAQQVYCVVDAAHESMKVTGLEGLAVWRARNTDVGGMFPVNPPVPRIGLVGAKRSSGDFVVDCISTDGGCIPRNVIVEMGLALVALEALTLEGFVRKTSWNPSRMLRLAQKGSLAVGMDADVTVLDLERRKAVATVAAGRVAMLHGKVVGEGTQVICTDRGQAAVRACGLEPYVADPSIAPLAMSASR